jgi:3-hydroxyisobutyrate dehydrogenase-like beta-hydroxyacid dehydrogenase
MMESEQIPESIVGNRWGTAAAAGGEKETFEQCVPIYESIAKQWFLIGRGSSGIEMKLVVNLLLGLDMQAIAEAGSLGEHLQIDRGVLLGVRSSVFDLIGETQRTTRSSLTPNPEQYLEANRDKRTTRHCRG